RRFTRSDTDRAVEFFSAALAIDPQFANAWAMLGAAHAAQAVHKWLPAREGVDRAQTAVTRALVIDPGHAAAHDVLGVLHTRFYWNWTRAQTEFKRACELDPGSDQAAIGLAFVRDAIIGRFDPALVVFRDVLARNPLDLRALEALGWAQFAI